ncbi:thiamine pyrophosphate-binding protein [Geobacter pelophilus]|uniref:Thiamine pyrophosphate-binding protein n=1 Tax=Geoanaerobacter pelophilus TaxID=60036 RepID=A0AAW4LDS0_9BACT|nr:thiamine pyrophosphate-binding protein [Geoanaerobacter pelophilus]MBT0665291.1 thiamine pyrophosphate-binding protein [Geoanaerobacter pelophilus]
MNAAEVIVDYLEKHGVEYVFGVPGGAIEPLNNALHKSKIKVIVAKHEEGAAFMADGFARVSGNISVCCSTAGPGATNMITGLASSCGDSIPVIALTGQVATSLFGKGAIQEFAVQSFSIVSMFRHISKYSDIVINEKKAWEMISKARRLALSGRKGPVHLNLPTDIMKRKAGDSNGRCNTTQVLGFDREGVIEAAKLLMEAERPVIVAGWGSVLSQADKELLMLAEMMDIPVATSPKAKGVISEAHPLSLGVLGFAGSLVSQEYILSRDVDVMLAVGTSFNEFVTSGWDKRLRPMKSLIQIDIDCNEIGKNYYVDVGIAGDAKTVLHELAHQLLRQSKTSGKLGVSRRQEVQAIKEEFAVTPDTCDNLPYKPARMIKDLSDSLPEDTIYFVDNGNSMAWAIHHLPITQPYTFYVGLGFASMGFATAAAIGAKLAAGARPVVSIVGDGSFLMNGMEVATAVNYKIPVIWVVMNNSMLGMVYHARKLSGIPEGIPSGFAPVDFVKLAEGLGARGIRITEPGQINRELIEEIISSGMPTVLDVIIDQEAVPPIQSRIASLEKLYT